MNGILNPNIGIPEKNIIMFCKKAKNIHKNIWNQNKNNHSSSQNLFLLSDESEFPLFEIIPKQFTISTKDGESHFNLELLINTSPVISDHIEANPNELQYHLNISDEENVLGKFEQLYLGKTVIFDEDELPISQRITKILQIKNCPNYLKPESLRYNNEIDSNGNYSSNNSDLNSGVEIYPKWFINFLQKEELQTFTIKTKRKEYKCNIFGIYASNIISQILEKDSTTSEYFYDFEDEFDEFQLICNLFNFKNVDITNDNMDVLKEMAESLQITYITKQIDNFINKYENFTQKVDEQHTIIDSIDNLFSLLYNIRMHGIQKVAISIANSQWSQTEENVQELAAFILQVVEASSLLHKEMTELLIQLNEEANDSNKLKILLPFIVNKLMTLYMKYQYPIRNNIDDYLGRQHEYIIINESSSMSVYFFIFFLYKKGIISKEEITDNLKCYYSCRNRYLNVFFLPEIVELKQKPLHIIKCLNDGKFSFESSNINKYNNFEQSEDIFTLFINKYWPDKIDLYKKMLDNMEPDDELTKSLRYDDVDKLQLIINQNGIDIPNAVVPYNIFDDLSENITIINYAAYCGALKCFKYLLLNNGLIDYSSLYFALYGGNIEIIKIVDQRHLVDDIANNHNNNNENRIIGLKNPDNNYITKIVNGKQFYVPNYTSDDLIIDSAIRMHRNDLFDWLFEKRFISKGKVGNELDKIASVSVANGNAHSLIEIFDKGANISANLIFSAAQKGFYKITQLLLSMIDQKAKNDIFNTINYGSYHSGYIIASQSSVYFGNLSIYKLFYPEMNEQNRETSVLYAILMNHMKIINYIFDDLKKSDNKISNLFVNLTLNVSLTKNTDEYFNYFMKQFKEMKPSAFSMKLFINLLNNACYHSNFSATKTITDFIIKENKNFNFSTAFINASSAGSKSICQYFIEKKVFINYEQISSKVANLGLIDEAIFKMIFKHVSSTAKCKILECINQAITRKNKKLIEFLLNEKAPMKNALFNAVSTHDVEIVNLILKYNSDPSFVNQINHEGTALLIAVKYSDIDIVKRLLSVPGINPSSANMHGENVLIAAVMNGNVDILDAILDFYGDDFQNHVWLYTGTFQALLRKMADENPKDEYWKVLKRFCEFKSIDLNLCEEYTFLYKACLCNKIDIVKSLLSLEKTDVNQYAISTYKTPLMVAIEKKNTKIAELLISNPKTDINAVDLCDDSAFIIAVRNNLKEIVDLLIKDERFDPIKSGFNFAFFNASNEIIEQLSSSEFLDVNYNYEIMDMKNNHRIFKEALEKTALIHSVEINDIEKFDFIINHPTFDKDKSDVINAIFAAAKNNNVGIFKKLIKLIDNDINIENQKGESLLVVSAHNLSGAIIDELFNDPRFDPINGQIVDAFIKAYCGTYQKQSLNNQTVPPWQYQPQKQFGYRPIPETPNWQMQRQNEHIWLNLHDVQNQQLIPDKSTRIEIMEKIVNFDREHSNLINFNQLLENGKSFFTVICQDYDEIEDVSDFLLDHGADPNMRDRDGIYPLLTAIGLNSSKFVSSLINSEKIVYSQLGNKTTYLHVAAAFAGVKILRFLLETNVFDVNATDINGETPLMLACRAKNIDKVVLLFEIDVIDYLHCNNAGIDALKILKNLPQNEVKNAMKSRDDYKEKIISILNDGPHHSFSSRSNNLLNDNISFIFGDQD
ncbi:hypothetical protein M9Y10_033130 [Tritrichomonas musculus]|uniref:Ankyrin repeat protein n=1 Tax=Tritrichomonas musculus TaxID=1915356 RepID=A0ABR2GYS3_9EUKA